MSLIRSVLSISVILFSAACTAGDDAPPATASGSTPGISADTSATSDAMCGDFVHVATLPHDLDEASAIAWSHARPGLLWANNDSNNPDILFALDTLGRAVSRVRLATRFSDRDLEDIAVAQCGDRDCLYIADIGDNYARRPFLRILRFEEPASPADSVASPHVFPFRYPDGGHDAEAMFVLPGERIFVITKGRNAPVALFRYPGALRPDTVTLEHVQNLSPGLAQFPDMVTGASASPDGRLIAVRTYAWLRLFALSDDGRLVPDPPTAISLAAAREAQGEGITIDDRGHVFLVSERGPNGAPAPIWKLRCQVGS